MTIRTMLLAAALTGLMPLSAFAADAKLAAAVAAPIRAPMKMRRVMAPAIPAPVWNSGA